MSEHDKMNEAGGISSILDDARHIIENARANAVRSVDFCRVQMYWRLGQRIFEEEQQGKERADYGAYIIRNVAACLSKSNTEAGLASVNWNGQGNFTNSTQLRPQCGRN